MPAKARVLSSAFCLLLAATGANAQQVMDNAAVIKLNKSGLGEELIVQTINASAGHYDTGTDALIALKTAGVSDKEIGAMIAKNGTPNGAPAMVAAAPSGSALPAGVDEIGLYYKDPTGAWTQCAPEIINFKSGGVMKSVFSQGIVKQDKNGHIPGTTAKLLVTRPVTILIYAPEGTAPNEYQLIKLRVNSDNREFRSETGGVFHNSTGAQRDDVTFTSVKVGPRLYQITLGSEFKPGEYGFLPPGAISTTNAASAGKMYTFHLTE